jgi:hypothetical protein
MAQVNEWALELSMSPESARTRAHLMHPLFGADLASTALVQASKRAVFEMPCHFIASTNGCQLRWQRLFQRVLVLVLHVRRPSRPELPGSDSAGTVF